jgi:hypothetical protein
LWIWISIWCHLHLLEEFPLTFFTAEIYVGRFSSFSLSEKVFTLTFA